MKAEFKIQFFSQGAKKFNEDYIGITENAWWLIDGTHVGDKITPNDAVWFITTLSQNIYKLINRFDLNLKIVLERALFKTSIEHYNMLQDSGINPKEYINPSGVIGAIRFNTLMKKIEIYKLGDVSLYFNYRGKEKVIEQELIGDEKLEQLEKSIIEKLEEYIREYNDVNIAMEYLTKELIKIRKTLMNKENGYYCLEVGREDVISKGELIEIPYTDMKEFKALMLSDGMYWIIDPFHRFEDMAQLMKFIELRGFSQLYNLLKVYEASDYNIQKYKRVKPIDDASGIYINISTQ